MINEVPALPTNWSAAVTQFIDGNIAGTPKGTTYFNQYYDEVKGYNRYEYPVKGRNELYRYNDKDPHTGCGMVYITTATKCSIKVLQEDDGTCTTAYLYQMAQKAKYQGTDDKGEHWNYNFDHLGI